jgi:hypothetical protein
MLVVFSCFLSVDVAPVPQTLHGDLDSEREEVKRLTALLGTGAAAVAVTAASQEVTGNFLQGSSVLLGKFCCWKCRE